MSTLKMALVGLFAGLTLAGCATTGTPIVAGAVDQVGLAVSGGVQDQGGNFTLGYRGAKFAIVPVENRNGDLLLIRDSDNPNGKQKGFSVFAMLGLDAKGGTAPGAGIVQVVAVGPAAETWAARAPMVVVRPQQ